MSKKIAILLAVFIIIINAAGCKPNNTDEASTASSQSESTTQVTNTDITNQYDSEDTDSSWDESSSTMIQLNNTSIEVDGNGASADGSIFTITAAGTYVLSGTLSDGQILINASDSNKVRLVLNGVNITCSDGAPIYASNADKLIIILADGTENTVTDGGADFTYADTANEEPDAAVFSKCDLSINGTGALIVNAGFNNGIGTKDDLVIASGSFTINAANDGIRGRDSMTILDGSFDITAGGDGLQSNNDEDTSKGWIFLNGGVYNINSTHDGVQAETILLVAGGEYTITTSGSSTGTSTSDTSDSYKGLKATTDLEITSGTFIIDSTDDSIHANGNIIISGGDFTISSGDDGVHADGDLSISGGNINITESYEGLEGATLNLSSGNISIVSSDDAINAAGGNDGGAGGPFGKDSFASSGDYYINISGGEINFTAGGDGIDSNGDITISGGNIIAIINSSADNGAIDGDQGTFTVTGGTIIYGGTGVGSVPGDSSAQSYVYVDSGISANTEVSVKKDGETLISFTPSTSLQYLALSSPGITSGESYEVYGGSSLITTVTAGSVGNTGMGGPGGGQGGMGTPPGGGGGGRGGQGDPGGQGI